MAWRERTGATAAVTEGDWHARRLRDLPGATGQGSARNATKAVFGIDGIPTYSLSQAETIILGADFLSTWGGPTIRTATARAATPTIAGSSRSSGPLSHDSRTRASTQTSTCCCTRNRSGCSATSRSSSLRSGRHGPASSLLTTIDVDALIAASGVSKDRIIGL